MTKMTRQHFNRIARYLSSAKPDRKRVRLHYQWVYDCATVARACEYFNRQFSYNRFMQECGAHEPPQPARDESLLFVEDE